MNAILVGPVLPKNKRTHLRTPAQKREKLLILGQLCKNILPNMGCFSFSVGTLLLDPQPQEPILRANVCGHILVGTTQKGRSQELRPPFLRR
jgi:hypothetical protein